MTKLKFTDKRDYDAPTFGDLGIGDTFTSVNGEEVFIKTKTMYDAYKNTYNTMALDGEFYWSEDDEEITPIRELEIIIKR